MNWWVVVIVLVAYPVLVMLICGMIEWGTDDDDGDTMYVPKNWDKK